MAENETVVLDEIVPPTETNTTPELETVDGPNEPTPQAPTPLSPGGKRFEQVYAMGKQAQRDLAVEREKRQALEAQVAALAAGQKKIEVYTPAQIETFVAEGRITRADATEYLKKQILTEAVQTAKQEVKDEFLASDRLGRLTQGIAEYVTHLPTITDVTSADRQKVEEEFEWLANVLGKAVDKLLPAEKKALELTALRNVFGSIVTVKKRTAMNTTPATTEQEISGGTPPARTNTNPDQALLNKLSAVEVAHYKKLMAAGRYKGGWKDVVAELKFDPKNRTSVKK